MQNELLEKARQQAAKSEPSVRAAALLRIARAESSNSDRARSTLLQGLDAVRSLPSPAREALFDEARSIAAAVSPDLLAEIPVNHSEARQRFTSGNIVQVMLTHGHVEAAFDYLLQYEDPRSFPLFSVGNVLHRMNDQDSRDRRLKLLRHAVEMWSRNPSSMHFHDRREFAWLLGYFWKEFPPEEALALTHKLIAQAAEEPDDGISSGYPDGIHFTSPRQDTLFKILHILRHLDPTLAQALIDSHDQLASAARRFPNGLETLQQEAEAEAERRNAEGPTCSSGYIFAGDPKDFDSHRRLVDATRSGNFDLSIQDAIEKYGEDTAPATRNYAPKEYWPSTGAFRTIFYHAGKHLGPTAVSLLDRIPDDELRLFATIELAAALSGVPASSINQMKRPRSPEDRARIMRERLSAQSSTDNSTMRSPDGRLIRCPKCHFQPPADCRWGCKCGHAWNTFWTSGNCPACHFQWEVTQCPSCGEMSSHQAWYVSAS